MIEYIGILATVCIFIGFTSSKIQVVRFLNLVGSLLFVFYGLSIGALSVWVLNGACAILNFYKMLKESKNI